uniref:EGF-like domain-containing protein n=1 Tax=Panagrellus redivivus TaxID=6233 RepID=A0A7E4VCG2_PANRE
MKVFIIISICITSGFSLNCNDGRYSNETDTCICPKHTYGTYCEQSSMTFILFFLAFVSFWIIFGSIALCCVKLDELLAAAATLNSTQNAAPVELYPPPEVRVVERLVEQVVFKNTEDGLPTYRDAVYADLPKYTGKY